SNIDGTGNPAHEACGGDRRGRHDDPGKPAAAPDAVRLEPPTGGSGDRPGSEPVPACPARYGADGAGRAAPDPRANDSARIEAGAGRDEGDGRGGPRSAAPEHGMLHLLPLAAAADQGVPLAVPG